MTVVIQWDSPWSHAADDYDLYLTSTDGTQLLGISDTTQNGTQNPTESVTLHNSGTTDAWEGVVISRINGSTRNLAVYVEQETRKISRDAFVAYRTNRYSVPWELAGREAKVQEVQGRIETLVGGH